MELSAEVSEGLQLAGDAAHVPDKLYPVLLKKVFRDIFTRPDVQKSEGKCNYNGWICRLQNSTVTVVDL